MSKKVPPLYDKEIKRWLWLRLVLRKRKIYDLADYVRAMIEEMYDIKVCDTKNAISYVNNKLPD